jgi:hypothetical protein
MHLFFSCRDEGYSRPLTEEELVERDRLLSENPFKDWMRRDFNAFLRACEKHGRQNIDAVAKEVESKTEEEVKAYAEVFFARYTELQDYEKYIKQIERGEQKIQRQQSIMKVCLRSTCCAALTQILLSLWSSVWKWIILLLFSFFTFFYFYISKYRLPLHASRSRVAWDLSWLMLTQVLLSWQCLP